MSKRRFRKIAPQDFQDLLPEVVGPGVQWAPFCNNLYVPQRDCLICPDEIVDVVIREFVFTDQGRLYGWSRQTRSIKSYRFYRKKYGQRQADIQRNKVRWEPDQAVLMNHFFPTKVLDHERDTFERDLARQGWNKDGAKADSSWSKRCVQKGQFFDLPDGEGGTVQRKVQEPGTGGDRGEHLVSWEQTLEAIQTVDE